MSKELNTQFEEIELTAVIRNGNQRLTASVTSFSRSGLKFTSQDIFAIGERLSFELQLGLGKITSILHVNGKIVDMRENEEDSLYTDYVVRYSFFGLFSKYSKYHSKDMK